MSIEKVIENGVVYRLEVTDEATVKMQVEPALMYDPPPASVARGTVVSIPMRLEDFDGERRNDTRTIRLLVQGEEVLLPLSNGQLTLELELAAPGRHRVTAMTEGLSMSPIQIEVL